MKSRRGLTILLSSGNRINSKIDFKRRVYYVNFYIQGILVRWKFCTVKYPYDENFLRWIFRTAKNHMAKKLTAKISCAATCSHAKFQMCKHSWIFVYNCIYSCLNIALAYFFLDFLEKKDNFKCPKPDLDFILYGIVRHTNEEHNAFKNVWGEMTLK